MNWLTDRWDVVLLAIAVYVAVMALVRLMARRRQELVADLERQTKSQRRRSKRKPPASKPSDAA